ncbi:hypothetical protein ACIRA2_33710 [Streptomyces griseoviridis]
MSKVEAEPEGNSESLSGDSNAGSQLLTSRSLAIRLLIALIGVALVSGSSILDSEGGYEENYQWSLLSDWVRTIGYIVIALAVLWIVFDALRLIEKRERERARSALASAPSIRASGEGATIHVHMPAGHTEDGAGTVQRLLTGQREESQERILEDSYIQGISQARVIFWVSIIFLCLGGAVLIGGAAYAILNNGSGGKVASGALAAASGVVSNLLSGIFLYQANRSRNSVSEQAVRLQASTIASHRIAIIRELLDSIDDPEHKRQAQVQLISTLVASLEDLDARQSVFGVGLAGPRTRSAERQSVNGQSDQRAG